MNDKSAPASTPPGDPPATVSVYRPAEALEPFVTFYYFVTTSRPVQDFLYPEWGNVRLVLSGEWQAAIEGAYDRVPPGAALFGPTDRRGEVTATAGRMLGFGLTPIGWHRLIGGDAVRMANGVRPLGDELGIASEALFDAFERDHDEAASVERWNALLGDLLTRRSPSGSRVIAIDQALRRGPADVAEFARLLGMSGRSLHRWCLAIYASRPSGCCGASAFCGRLGGCVAPCAIR